MVNIKEKKIIQFMKDNLKIINLMEKEIYLFL